MVNVGDTSTFMGRSGIVYRWDDAPNIDMRSDRLVWWCEELICIAPGYDGGVDDE